MLSQSPLPAPASVRKAQVVIVGAGPTGLLAALLLSQRGVKVTLVDASTTHPSVLSDQPRTMLLSGRALSAVRAVPGLEARLYAAGQPAAALRVAVLSADGHARLLHMPTPPCGTGGKLFILRNDLCRVLTERAVEDDARITMRYGTEVHRVLFTVDGFARLTLRCGTQRESILTTRMLIAADGRCSTIAPAVRAIHEQCSCVPRRFSERPPRQRWRVTVGDVHFERVILSDAVHAAVAARLPGGKLRGDAGFALTASDGDARLAASPVGPVGRVSLLGWPGVLVARAGNSIWNAGSVDALKLLLQERFPQVKEAVLDVESLHRVVRFGGMQLGVVRKAYYTGSEVGKNGRGGVVCLGGAGQKREGGPESSADDGFDDVRRMMLILDLAEKNVEIRELAWRFDYSRAPRPRLIGRAVQEAASYGYEDEKHRLVEDVDQVVVLTNVGCILPMSMEWSKRVRLVKKMHCVGTNVADPAQWGVVGAALVFIATAMVMRMRNQT